MLGFYDAWKEADRLQKQSEEEKLFYEAWDDADKLEEELKTEEKKRRLDKDSKNPPGKRLAQHARDAASLMSLAEALAVQDEEHGTDDGFDMFTDQCQWEEMIKKETDDQLGKQATQCSAAKSVETKYDQSEKTWVEVKEEKEGTENCSLSQDGRSLPEQIQSLLLDKLLRDALIERQLQPQQHDADKVSIQGSQAKASAVPPPAQHDGFTEGAPAKACAVPPPVPKGPPPFTEGAQAKACAVPPPVPVAPPEPQRPPERIRGFAGKEHEGKYYVPGPTMYYLFFNHAGTVYYPLFLILHQTATP